MSGVCQVKVDVYAQGGEDWEGGEKEEDQLGEESEQADEDITANILKSGLIASLATWFTYSNTMSLILSLNLLVLTHEKFASKLSHHKWSS